MITPNFGQYIGYITPSDNYCRKRFFLGIAATIAVFDLQLNWIFYFGAAIRLLMWIAMPLFIIFFLFMLINNIIILFVKKNFRVKMLLLILLQCILIYTFRITFPTNFDLKRHVLNKVIALVDSNMLKIKRLVPTYDIGQPNKMITKSYILPYRYKWISCYGETKVVRKGSERWVIFPVYSGYMGGAVYFIHSTDDRHPTPWHDHTSEDDGVIVKKRADHWYSLTYD